MKILTTNKLTKKYDALNVVDEVSMTINKGDIYGLIGRNGAGKTTLLRMICGVTKPTSGKVKEISLRAVTFKTVFLRV